MRFLRAFGIERGLIDWHLDPLYTYGLFECRGDMTVVRSSRERYYYFFIDNWQKPPRLCFMERGLRHARVLAEIDAPRRLIDQCIARQGEAIKYQSLAIDEPLRDWLRTNVVEPADFSRVRRLDQPEPAAGLEEDLEPAPTPLPEPTIILRAEPTFLDETAVTAMIHANGFFESRTNPSGRFPGRLVATGDHRTVLDCTTGLMWMRSGSDIGFFRRQCRWIEELNRQRFAGFDDWRLPTLEEVLSLVRPERNDHGLYLPPCFSPVQGFLYSADRRRPGGYWFVDFNQARAYWAGGTFNGGFARACRSAVPARA